jgi:DNA invertase Pin-like site-specific DNA recombinase
MYNDNKKISDIIEKVGCSDVTIYRVLRKNNISLRRKKIDHNKILSLAKGGEKVATIAFLENCTRDTVYRILRKNSF